MTPQECVIGTWRLVSFVTTNEQGSVRDYWDANATTLVWERQTTG